MRKHASVSVLCRDAKSDREPYSAEWLCRQYAQQNHSPIIDSMDQAKTVQVLVADGESLKLYFPGQDDFGAICVDFNQPRSVIKNDPLIRAMGRRARTVIDATAGWCGDALNLACHGLRVTAIEQNELVTLMLNHAWHKASSEMVRSHLSLVKFNSIAYLQALESKVDVVYLDPMYPHRRKSSKSKKALQALQLIVGPPQDESLLMDVALTRAAQRVVVKRPHYAEPLLAEKSGKVPHKVGEIKTKLVRFDIYKPLTN